MINRIVLVGRLTKDPELRLHAERNSCYDVYTGGGSVLYEPAREPGNGFYSHCCVETVGRSMCQLLEKGRLTGVDGRLQIRSFDNEEGRRVTVAEVVAENVRFLEPKDGIETAANKDDDEAHNDPFAGGTSEPLDISDDDLPF